MGCTQSNEVDPNDELIIRNDRKNNSKNSFKIVFLGKSGVGKTSITIRHCHDTFEEGIEATIGASFLSKMILFKDRHITLEMWDTAGQERFRALTPMYYRNADAAVLVYDITDEESFGVAKSWYHELKKNVRGCEIILAGNKLDLISKRKVDKTKVEQFAQEAGIPLFELSSKDNTNIPELFKKLGEMLTDKYPE